MTPRYRFFRATACYCQVTLHEVSLGPPAVLNLDSSSPSHSSSSLASLLVPSWGGMMTSARFFRSCSSASPCSCWPPKPLGLTGPCGCKGSLAAPSVETLVLPVSSLQRPFSSLLDSMDGACLRSLLAHPWACQTPAFSSQVWLVCSVSLTCSTSTPRPLTFHRNEKTGPYHRPGPSSFPAFGQA